MNKESFNLIFSKALKNPIITPDNFIENPTFEIAGNSSFEKFLETSRSQSTENLLNVSSFLYKTLKKIRII